MKEQFSARRLALAGVLAAVAVIGGAFTVPIGAARPAPVQHMVNVVAGVLLGPGYAVGVAFVASLLRNLMGTGTLLAFPGSMVGALCCGLLYARTQRLTAAYVGEIVGTGILGAVLSCPIAVMLMGRTATLFAFVPSFLASTALGATIAIVVVGALSRTGTMDNLRRAMR